MNDTAKGVIPGISDYEADQFMEPQLSEQTHPMRY